MSLDLVLGGEEWEDSAAARMLLIFVGGMLIFAGFRLWAALEPNSPLGVIAVVATHALAVQLLIFSVTDVDMDRWGRIVAYTTLAVFLLAVIAALLRAFLPLLSTDAMMFSAYSTQLVAEGQNPYTASMLPAFEQSGVATQFSTPRIDGTTVAQLSYPAGAVLAFTPQYVTVGRTPLGLRMTLLLVAVGCAGFLIYEAPPNLALGGFAAMIGSRNLFFTAAGGVLDPLWVLPVLFSMRAWAAQRWTRAAVWFGLAASMKQNPWPIALYLAIWLWYEHDTTREFAGTAARTITAGLGTFTLINLPFIIDAPRAWVFGVVTPVAGGAPMVHQGVGLTMTTVTGIYPLTTTWHTHAVIATILISAVGYAYWIDQLKWAAWVMPILIYFVHYRSLESYFTHFLPIAFAALLYHYQVARSQQADPSNLSHAQKARATLTNTRRTAD